MLHMGISGYDIYDAIQADAHLRHIPVIAVSASDPEIEIPRARMRGFAGFISEPLNLVRFPEQVAACLSGKPVWTSSYDG